MRYVWLIISLALLGLIGVGVAQKAGELRTPPRLPKNPSPFEWLQAGYKEIPDNLAACPGTPQGTIHIRLSNVLGDLNVGKTVFRNMTYVSANGVTGPLAVQPRILRAGEKRIKGFPTNLDFMTTVERNGVRTRLLNNSGDFVLVRITLDKTPAAADGSSAAANESVEFLHETVLMKKNLTSAQIEAIESNSRFAVLQAYGVKEGMFVCRRPIRLDGAKNPFVEFGVKSVGGPYSGSFGIGLVVHDPVSPYVTPIIIDPNVENEG
jgi:hypothetical protein